MKCVRCRRALDKGHMKNAVKIHANGTSGPAGHGGPGGGTGAIKGIYHLKCYKATLREDPAQRTRRGMDHAPSAYSASLGYGNKDDASEEARARREAAERQLEELKAAQANAMAASAGGNTDEEGRADLSELISDEATGDHEHDLSHIEEATAKAEQELALARRQEELAQQRAAEDNRSGVDTADPGFADQRDPDTIDI